jgi:hypothetical protein
MNNESTLTGVIFEKWSEQIDLTCALISLIPEDKLDWSPARLSPNAANAFRLDELLGHLLDCLAGVCAALHAMHPQRLAHLAELRDQEVNHRCGVEEARRRIRTYAHHIERGFNATADADLSRLIPTIFVPEGEAALTLLLGNLEHLINHKHQLFFYLKLLCIPVGTSDLYCFRGESGS